MRRHAMFSSPYPPADELYVSSGCPQRDISLMLCHGWSRATVVEYMADTLGEWEFLYPGVDKPDSPDKLVDPVIEAYRSQVSEASAHYVALTRDVGATLQQQGIYWSWGEGWDSGEAVARARSRSSQFAYVHQQDIDRLIHSGKLYVGFGPGDDTGAAVATALRHHGVTAEFSGELNDRIVCQNVLFEAPPLS